MVDVALLDYIQRQLKRGFSAQDVSSFLIHRGYSQQAIEECFEHVYTNPPEKPKHNNTLLLAVMALFIIGIIGVLSYSLFIGSQPEQQPGVDFRINLVKSSYEVGDDVSFNRILDNKADDPREIRITYTIRDSSGNMVHTMDEQIMLATADAKSMNVDLSDIQPGSYTIEAKAYFSGNLEQADASFRVNEEEAPNAPTCFDGIKNQGEEDRDCGGPCKKCIKQCPIYIDDNNPCTIDKCGSETNFREVHEDIVPCCGNGVCESNENNESCEQDCSKKEDTGYFDRDIQPNIEFVEEDDVPLSERIEQIRKLSSGDLDMAMQLCAAIVFEYYKDECFYGVGEETSDPRICDQIKEERTKDKCFIKLSKQNEDPSLCGSVESNLRGDSCYMRFALKGDYTVCDNIKDDYYIQSCKQLKQIGENAPEAVKEYSENIE